MNYKNQIIDTSTIYGNKVSVNMFGEDFIFNTIEEAKKFIDENGEK